METRTLSWVRTGVLIAGLALLAFIYFFAGNMLQSRGFVDVSAAWLVLQAHTLLVGEASRSIATLFTWPPLPYLLIVAGYPIAGGFTPVVLSATGLIVTLYLMVRVVREEAPLVLKLALYALFVAHPALLFIAIGGGTAWVLIPAFVLLVYDVFRWVDQVRENVTGQDQRLPPLHLASLAITMMVLTDIRFAGLLVFLIPVLWVHALRGTLPRFGGILGSFSHPESVFRSRTLRVLRPLLGYPSVAVGVVLLASLLVGGTGVPGFVRVTDAGPVLWVVFVTLPFMAVLLISHVRDFCKIWVAGSPLLLFLLLALALDVSDVAAAVVGMVSLGTAIALGRPSGAWLFLVAALISVPIGYRYMPAMESTGIMLAWDTFQMKERNPLVGEYLDDQPVGGLQGESPLPEFEAAEAEAVTEAGSMLTTAATADPIAWDDTPRYYMEVRSTTLTGPTTLIRLEQAQQQYNEFTLMPEFRDGLRMRWLIGTGRYATFRDGVAAVEQERGSATQAWIILYHRTDFRLFGAAADLDPTLPQYRIQLGTFPTESAAQASQTAWTAVGMSQTEVIRTESGFALQTGAYNDRDNAELLSNYIRQKSGVRVTVVSVP